MLLIYDYIIRLFVLAFRVAALFNPKAKLWVEGRRNWRKRYAAEWFQVHSSSSIVHRSPPVLWIHAASLGEFEQGRPIIEAFRERYPDWKIVLTFFSPSGYEIRKNYPHADCVVYLPADTHQNARDFLDLIQPDVAIFIKYEFWANYLLELKKRGTPTLLVSALFRPSQPFFKWYGRFWRKMLDCFSHIFVQNESSGKLLESIGIQKVTIAGDTRVDRVLKIAAEAPTNDIVQAFVGEDSTNFEKGSNPVLVVGSSWEADENIIFTACNDKSTRDHSDTTNWKLIIAPHEPSEVNVERICKQAGNAERYSNFIVGVTQSHPDNNCLVIDNMGLLNTLYRYGSIAYIGGGFGKDIHNTLEPAAFGLPILFGPKYEKFEEARQFVARGGAFPVQNAEDLVAILARLKDPVFYQKAADAVRSYLEENRGATGKVMAFLEEYFEENATRTKP